ncbi:MAG: 23S rRNA (guanosine(2251)-2'-O)-methyltransferase RlmB [Actinomycetota bacterium]|nr:23S rRNA (guanosine(2251)-2'-O)-methyltransferase RlmB [Actinomycetota bacterium]
MTPGADPGNNHRRRDGGTRAGSTGAGGGGTRAGGTGAGAGGGRAGRASGTGAGGTGSTSGRARGGRAGGGRAAGGRSGANPAANPASSSRSRSKRTGTSGSGLLPRQRPRVQARDREPARDRADAATPLRPLEATARRRGRSVAPELGGEQVEGRHAVRALLAARRRPVRQVWLAEGLDPSPILDGIAALAAAASVPVRIVNPTRLRQASSTDAPQGVLAFAEPLPESDLDDLAADRPDGRAPFLVVVDGLTDPHNLGALLRTAQCAGATGAVLPRHRSAHVTATVAKAAAGAIEYLPIAVVPGIPSALARLADAGVWTVGLDASARQALWSLSVATEPIAIVLGAEGSGLSRLAKVRCQLLVAIPQAGPIASLNVAAAGALACFEVSRARPEAGVTVDTPPWPG